MMTFDVAFVAFRAGQADAALAALAALSGDEHVEAIRQALDVLADLPVGEAGPLLVALEPELMRAPCQIRDQVCADLHDELRAHTDRLLAEVRRRGWFTIAGTLTGSAYLSYTARPSGAWPGRRYELRRSADHRLLWAEQRQRCARGFAVCCPLGPPPPEGAVLKALHAALTAH